jgi:hypothetical protein
LREEKYTIEGAKKILSEGSLAQTEIQGKEEISAETMPHSIAHSPRSLKKDLEEVKSFLVYLQSSF